jgi:segregation and condensation protein A
VTGLVAEAAVRPGTDEGGGGFHVRLENFEGPFDLLLQLISRRKLDITEIALSTVTDDFLAHLSGAASWDLGKATEFLVVASTLLDLKAARLLPVADVEDEEDVALLEARDLLFARLLQYRAYKVAAAYLGELERAQARRHPRPAVLDPRFAALVPDVLLEVDPLRFAQIAAAALAVKPVPTVELTHVHAAPVSVAEQMALVRHRLNAAAAMTFRSLVADCQSTAAVVARFLALLELYREGVVAFDQLSPLAELRIRRIRGSDHGPSAAGEPAGASATADTARSVDEEYV